MFISDFAIRRPIITVVVMIALVVFGIVALAKLQTDEFPDIDAPIVVVGIVYPGASPETGRARGRRPDRGRASSAISGLDEARPSSSIDGFAQIIVSFDFDKPTRAGDAGRARRDQRDPRQTSRPRWKSRSSRGSIRRDMPIVTLTLTSLDPHAGAAHPARRPGDRRRAPRHRRASPGDVVGGTARELNVELRPEALAARRRRRRSGRARAAGAEPRRAGGAGERAAHRARHPAQGRLERPEEFAQLASSTQRNGQAGPARAGGHGAGRLRGAAHPRRSSTAARRSGSTS